MTLKQKHISFKTVSKLGKSTHSCNNSVLSISNSKGHCINWKSALNLFMSTKHSLIFLFFCYYYYFLLYFTLQYCIGFAIHWHESTMGVHEFPILNHPLPPTPYHLSGSSPCTSPKHPVSCINIDWQFVSNMIIYMFQCHSPKSSHPLPLPQSPKVRSTHLCLFCCLTYRVIITIFLNSTYMC